MQKLQILTSPEIDKIKAEQILISKLRQELKHDDEKNKGVWKWLNSPLLLLIFSAGILSWAGQYITATIQAEKESNEFRKSIKSHLIELDVRIAEFDRITSRLLKNYSDDIASYLGFISDGDTTGYYKASSPEYKGVSLITLLAWFRVNTNKTNEMQKAYDAVISIPSLRDDKWKWDVKKFLLILNALKLYRDQLNENY